MPGGVFLDRKASLLGNQHNISHEAMFSRYYIEDYKKLMIILNKVEISFPGVLLLLLTYVAFSFALYSPGDDVIELTPQNFHSKVIQGDELWIIEFYAPW